MTPTTSSLGPVPRHRLADDVAGQLADAIHSGELELGSRLVEIQLATTLGVSRAPVREAFRLLEQQGLAEARNGLYYVTRLEDEDLREVTSLRIALERLAIARVVRRATDDDLAELEAIVAEMRRAVEAAPNDQNTLSRLDSRFHACLCRLAGHRRLHDLWTGMDDPIRLAIATANLSFHGGEGFPEDHDEVLAAIRTRDVAHAERVIEQHIRNGFDPDAPVSGSAGSNHE